MADAATQNSLKDSYVRILPALALSLLGLCSIAGKPALARTISSTSTSGEPDANTAKQQYAAEEAMRAGRFEDARRILEPLAQQGDSNAQANLATFYATGKGGLVRNDGEAFLLFMKAANQGHPMAQYSLGLFFSQGLSVRVDKTKAAYWYRKGAEQGFAPAQYNLGVVLRDGEGVPRDYAEAFGWFQKAAEQGHTGAEVNLGTAYSRGQGVKQDHFAAVSWFRKAADKNDAQSEFNLGISYYLGQGVSKDYAVAAEWFQKAAEHGHAQSQYEIGALYGQGIGVAQDLSKSALWLEKAAEQGHQDAQFNLGIMFMQGEGVEKNPVKAYMWFALTEANPARSDAEVAQHARAARNHVAKLMTLAQIAEAKSLALEWKPSSGLP